jgi:hypothetical protein
MHETRHPNAGEGGIIDWFDRIDPAGWRISTMQAAHRYAARRYGPQDMETGEQPELLPVDDEVVAVLVGEQLELRHVSELATDT